MVYRPPLRPAVRISRVLLRPDAEYHGNNDDYQDQTRDHDHQREFQCGEAWVSFFSQSQNNVRVRNCQRYLHVVVVACLHGCLLQLFLFVRCPEVSNHVDCELLEPLQYLLSSLAESANESVPFISENTALAQEETVGL